MSDDHHHHHQQATHCCDHGGRDAGNVSASDPAPTGSGEIWTCPMHPQIRWDHAGNCPICGMALEPLQPSLEDEVNPELKDMTRRFWLSALLSIPVVTLAMGPELFGGSPLPMR